MRKYRVIFYFTDKNGFPETYEDGTTVYHDEIIKAYNGGEAIGRLKDMCEQQPEIVSITIVEEQNERVI